MRHVIVVSVLALCIAGLLQPAMLWAQARPPLIVPPPPSPLPQTAPSEKPRIHAEMATELLDRLQAVFGKLSGPADEADLGHQLSVLADTGRERLDARIITPAFHARFARVLLVVRLATITDTGQILKPIVNKEFVAFVRDVAGKTYNPRAPISDQIGMISDAVATELTRLRALARQLR